MAGSRRAPSAFALTVHGPAGVVDLLVPSEASVLDVANEYAAQAGLAAVPALATTRGGALAPDRSLAASGIVPGELLVVLESAPALRQAAPARREIVVGSRDRSWIWCSVAAAVAVVAGWFGAHASEGRQDAVAAVLLVAAVLGVVPIGRYAAARSLAAPAFAGAAGFVLTWTPQPDLLPTAVGVAALVAAVAAGVARALGAPADDGLRVWTWAGTGVFVLAMLGAFAGTSAQVVWAVLLVLAMLAPRFVPAAAVDVPDQMLLDLERLAVTAWSARERPVGRRGRMIVRPTTVAEVAERGAAVVTAASVAVLVLAAVASAALLATVTDPVDRVGSVVLVACAGCGLLLAARSYRHRAARAVVRAAGLACLLVVLGGAYLAYPGARDTGLAVVAVGSILVGLLVVCAAVATGRGWRSVWWSRRAELAESLVGAGAIAALVVATGLFAHIWQNLPDV